VAPRPDRGDHRHGGRLCIGAAAGAPLSTVSFQVDNLRPAIDTTLIATATVRRSGRLVCVVDIGVADEAVELVAVGRATYATLV
jgi:uncharacterized protein (TIGR00369 family)